MHKKLTQKERLLTASIYLIIIFLIYFTLNGEVSIFNQNNEHSIWFYSGILLIIMGKYITEPYFPTPADTLSNSISTLLLLLTLNIENKLVAYKFIFSFSIFLIVLSLANMILKDNFYRFERISYFILKNLGSSNFIFSTIYISATFTYFGNPTYVYESGSTMIITAMTLWFLVVFFDIVAVIINKIYSFFSLFKRNASPSINGLAVKNEENSYVIELEKTLTNIESFENNSNNIFAIKNSDSTYLLSSTINVKTLIEKIWLDTVLLNDQQGKPILINKDLVRSIGLQHIRNHPIGTAVLLDFKAIEPTLQSMIKQDYHFKNYKNFIGRILPSSNINTIRFSTSKNTNKILDGTIITTKINNRKVLYQVINGFTEKESLTNETNYEFINGVARKLGYYDSKEYTLDSISWLPLPNEPVYLHYDNNERNLDDIAKTAIGRLPKTNMKIPIKDINSLVTHNTAILGILGVGKSYLTFELIKKTIEENIKVICIDITNQYGSDKGLINYIVGNLIQNDLTDEHLKALKGTSTRSGNQNAPTEWGNIEEYKKMLKMYIERFFKEDSSKKVLIFNPDNHIVKRADVKFNIVETIHLTIVEKSKIISEVLLDVTMSLGQTDRARCCLVLEEAHSIAPEWNSVADPGDSNHSNALAKVILQGRKFGLGCFLVTQRTANVTKSILNQCNTIFALRIYDDTGKSFLENYIGKDYSDTLPTLEDRHAIVIGKAIGLKQPVVIELNDAKFVQIQ